MAFLLEIILDIWHIFATELATLSFKQLFYSQESKIDDLLDIDFFRFPSLITVLNVDFN